METSARPHNERHIPQIAVIVPCHNIAPYVTTCLDSLAAQTFRDFEAVLVDDGSTDATGEILDAFAAAHEGFRVIHQECEGQSAARNAGVAASVAPLLAFVDGDDYADVRYLEVLHDLAVRHGVDIACCGHRKATAGRAPRFDAAGGAAGRVEILSAGEALRLVAVEGIQLAAWDKLIRRELIEANQFSEGHVYEDLRIVGPLVSAASKIARTSLPLYCYVSRPESTTRSAYESLDTFWDFREAIDAFERSYERALGLAHATDDPSYCVHLVHRVCGLYATLQRTECDGEVRSALEDALRDELGAAYRLAIGQGVSRLNPQMARAALFLVSPALCEVAFDAYRRVTGG